MLGVEGDFTYNVNQTGKADCNCTVTPGVFDLYTIKNRLQGSARGRLGYLLKSSILPFISAGGSFADLSMAYNNEVGNVYSTKTIQSGWVVGAGLEWGFADTCSVRAEYYYIDYNKIKMGIPTLYGLYDPNASAAINFNSNNLRLAVNYWF